MVRKELSTDKGPLKMGKSGDTDLKQSRENCLSSQKEYSQSCCHGGNVLILWLPLFLSTSSRHLGILCRLRCRTIHFLAALIASRFACASALPCAAAFSNQLTAFCSSLSTPSPVKYIAPKLFCASTCPCSAAFLNNSTA